MTRRSAPRRQIALMLLLATGGAGSGSLAQRAEGVQVRTPMETTDDPRRVPIPPRNRSNDPLLVLHGGTLIDGTDAAPVPDAVLVMRGDRILAAGPASSVAVPANTARTIDVTGLHIVPGLIDLHVHFRQQRGEDFGMYRDSEAAIAIRGVEKLGQLLDGGITAIRELGGPGDVALKLKEAVERRIFAGPRVFWAGQIIVTRGGHGDETTATASGRPKPLATNPGVRIANGAGDWRLAVREQIRMGVDVIKITSPFTREEVTAAVDEAHMHGIRVTADAFGKYVQWAAEAGIDSIEHPLDISEEALRAMKANGTALVPTITAFYNPLTFGYPSAGIPAGGFFYTMSRRFNLTHEASLETVRKARELGLTIGVGTDIPFENERRYPSDYFTELGFLADAGFTDREVLLAATSRGAEILGMDDKLGTLEPGKLADVLVVDGNPLEDFRSLRNMRLVIADGRVVRDRRTGDTTQLAGTWELTSYESPVSVGSSAAGQMIFDAGRFSTVYTMQNGDRRWGRAHAGRYSVDGDQLTLLVDWSMEQIPGGSSVASQPLRRETRFEIANGVLTIRFDNGAVQQFRRLGRAPTLQRP